MRTDVVRHVNHIERECVFSRVCGEVVSSDEGEVRGEGGIVGS